MMFPLVALLDVGGMELALIFFAVLLLFGGQKLPEFARGLGKSIREFKKASAGVEQEIRRAMESEPEPAPRPHRTLPASGPTDPMPAPKPVEPAPPETPKPPFENSNPPA